MTGAVRSAVQSGQDGVDVVATFLGPPGRRVFAVHHLPRTPRAGVVICPPLFAELVTSYRRDVVRARLLAAAGIATSRLHYRGSGHSDEAPGATRDDLTDDVLTVLEDQRRHTGAPVVATLGAGIGAFVAAPAAARSGGPLVLVQPAPSTDLYFREFSQVHLMHLMRSGRGGRPRRLGEQIARDGHVELLGYRVDAALFASLAGRSVRTEIEGHPAPVLLVQFSLRTAPLREYADLAVVAGVDFRLVPAGRTSVPWLLDEEQEPPDHDDATVDLTAVVARWVADRAEGVRR